MSDPDEPWPFTWSAPGRAMSYLDVERVRIKQEEFREVIPAVMSAMGEAATAFPALFESLRQLREALGKLREVGR
jgi:hypothetical protein